LSLYVLLKLHYIMHMAYQIYNPFFDNSNLISIVLTGSIFILCFIVNSLY